MLKRVLGRAARNAVAFGALVMCVVLATGAEAQGVEVTPHEVWDGRIDWSNLKQLQFDETGAHLLIDDGMARIESLAGDATRNLTAQDYQPDRRLTAQGQRIVQMVRSSSGDDVRHRIFVSEPGQSEPVLDVQNLSAGDFPDLMSSMDGIAHLVIPSRGQSEDDRPLLITATSPNPVRLDLDMSDYPFVLAVTNDGLALVLAGPVLLIFGPDGTQVGQIVPPGTSIDDFSFDPSVARLSGDQTLLALPAEDAESGAPILRVFNTASQEVLAEYAMPDIDDGVLHDIAFTDIGMRVAFYTYGNERENAALVYDLALDAEPVLAHEVRTKAEYIRPILDQSGQHLALATSDGQVKVLSFAPAPVLDGAPAPLPELVAGLGGLNVFADVQISPDNRLLVTADRKGEVWLWDLESGRAIRSFGTYDSALLKFSTSGDTLLVKGDGDPFGRTFDVRTGKVVGQFRASAQSILFIEDIDDDYLLCYADGCVVQSADFEAAWQDLDMPMRLSGARLCGDTLAVYYNEPDGPKTLFRYGWDGQGTVGEPLQTGFDDDEINAISCAPASDLFVGTKGGRIHRVNARGEITQTDASGSAQVLALATLPGEALLSVREGHATSTHDIPARIEVRALTTLETLFDMPVPLSPGGSGRYLDMLTLSDDMTRAVTSTQNTSLADFGSASKNNVALWDIEALRARLASAEITMPLAPDAFLIGSGIAAGGRKSGGISFSPDGRALAVNFGADSALWSLETGQVTAQVPHGIGGGVKFSQDGVFLSGIGSGVFFAGQDNSTRALPLPKASARDFMITSPAMSIAGNTIAQATDNGTVIWPDIHSSGAGHVLALPGSGTLDRRTLDASGQRLLIQRFGRLTLQDTTRTDQPTLWTLTPPGDGSWSFDTLGSAAFSADGTFVMVPIYGGTGRSFLALDPDSGAIVHRVDRGTIIGAKTLAVRVAAYGNAPEQMALLEDDGLGFGQLRMGPTDDQPADVNLLGLSPAAATLSPDGQLLVVSGINDEAVLWDRRSGRSQRLDAQLAPAIAPDLNVGFSPDGAVLALAETSGAVTLFRTETADPIGRLLGFVGGGWATVSADGRYDASDPGNVGRLSWVLQDDPLFPIPVEAFVQEYYEPRLMGRLLSGEALPDVAPPQDRNRVTPSVEIYDIRLDEGKADGARSVTLDVVAREGSRQGATSGLGTIKLFRDGQLVAQREGAQLDADGQATVQFEGVALPPDAEVVTWSAYAFNDDSIKGQTAQRTYQVPGGAASDIHRRAFVIAVGVNAYDNPAWNLSYAATDAKVTAQMLGQKLRDSGAFDEVYNLALTSDLPDGLGTPRLARRDMIETVLQQLAGTAPARRQSSPLPILPKARPQDLVYLAFAGHGLADADGTFHFFTQDFGAGLQGRTLPDDLSASSLDSNRLSTLLRGIDAGEMVVVIDACNAAASVEGSGFKPGPMGSRGLGQLAYDKSMRVLAASQAEEVALESDTLRHGALTYALLREGLEAAQADVAPTDGAISLGEMLSFSRDRVPVLYNDLRQGTFEPLSRGAFTMEADVTEEPVQVQQPALFDFRRSSRADVTLRAP